MLTKREREMRVKRNSGEMVWAEARVVSVAGQHLRDVLVKIDPANGLVHVRAEGESGSASYSLRELVVIDWADAALVDELIDPRDKVSPNVKLRDEVWEVIAQELEPLDEDQMTKRLFMAADVMVWLQAAESEGSVTGVGRVSRAQVESAMAVLVRQGKLHERPQVTKGGRPMKAMRYAGDFNQVNEYLDGDDDD